MLTITLEFEEVFDELTETFQVGEYRQIEMEHSLLAISKWEAIWETSFLNKKEKTSEELLSYLECMCVHDEDIPYVSKFQSKDVEKVAEYMNRKMTAAWFVDSEPSGSKPYITSEDIYYQMLGNGIPIECERWNLKRLLALIRTFQEKREPEKKMSKKELMTSYRELNKKRREKYNTKG